MASRGPDPYALPMMMPANVYHEPTIVVRGLARLSGSVYIQPSKNAAQKILPSTALFPGKYRVENLPHIADAAALLEVLRYLDCDVRIESDTAFVDTEDLVNRKIPRDLTARSTGTFLFAGALLARFGKARIAHPGGDRIGPRPVNLHLDAFRALGAEVSEHSGYYDISAPSLAGTQFRFGARTVNGTVNAILVAAGASGTTVIENAAYDPDIQNVVEFLNSAGCEIKFEDRVAGRIRVVGSARGAGRGTVRVISDRNDAATFAVAAAICRGQVRLVRVAYDDLRPLCDLLTGAGVTWAEGQSDGLPTLSFESKELRSLSGTVVSERYPGISTDWGPLIQVLMTQVPGESVFEETVYSNRFAHVPELVKFGAQICLASPGCKGLVDGASFDPEMSYKRAYIQGPTKLQGCVVKANDVRAGAALVLAGLASDGVTTVRGTEQVERGYERFVERLQEIGADIQHTCNGARGQG